MRLRPLLFLLVAALAPTAARAACTPTPAIAPLVVNFLGVTTIVLRAGGEAIMVDGFFSRPRVLSMGGLRPSRRRVLEGLDRAGIGHRESLVAGARLLALFVAQAHHDHSMDSGIVAIETGATLVGSSSTGEVALGTAPDLEAIDRVSGGEERCFGPFRVRIIESPHARGLFTRWLYGEIGSPLRPRRWVFAYDDTRNFSFLVSYGTRSILIHPSAAFPKGGLGDFDADLVFLSVGDLGRQTDDQIAAYWDMVVRDRGAHMVVPVHWDNFFRAVDLEARRPGDRLKIMPLSRHARAMERLCEGAGGVQIRQLDAFEEVGLEDLLQGHAQVTDPCLRR